MKVAIVALLAVLAVGVLWAAGEMHARSCQDAGKVGCSVLPWSGDDQPAARFTPSGCADLKEARRLSPIETTDPLPLECR